MPISISPALSQLAYQRSLLAQMGITPWISQQSPVLDFDTTLAFEPQDLVLENQTIFVEKSMNAHNANKPKTVDTISQRPVINAEQNDFIVASSTPSATKVSITPENHTYTNPPICRYQIQAMVLPHWLFIADEQVLQQDSQQYELWQNIAKSMQGRFYRLQFPLVHDTRNRQILSSNTTDPQAMQQLFTNEAMGLASFNGFIHSLLRDNMQIGYLTPLPQLLYKYPMQALPSLAQMLNTPSVKRELWQIMQTLPS